MAAQGGLDARNAYTRKAKEALARIEGIQLTGAQQEERPVLRPGSTGEVVGAIARHAAEAEISAGH